MQDYRDVGGMYNIIDNLIHQEPVFENECAVLDVADNYLWDKIPEIPEGPDGAGPGPNPGNGPFECGFALEFSGFDSDLNGNWFLTKDTDGKMLESGGYPYYQQKIMGKDTGFFMFWMVSEQDNGEKTGHWIINQTPGNYGNEDNFLKGSVEEFYCPQARMQLKIFQRYSC